MSTELNIKKITIDTSNVGVKYNLTSSEILPYDCFIYIDFSREVTEEDTDRITELLNAITLNLQSSSGTYTKQSLEWTQMSIQNQYYYQINISDAWSAKKNVYNLSFNIKGDINDKKITSNIVILRAITNPTFQFSLTQGTTIIPLNTDADTDYTLFEEGTLVVAGSYSSESDDDLIWASIVVRNSHGEIIEQIKKINTNNNQFQYTLNTWFSSLNPKFHNVEYGTITIAYKTRMGLLEGADYSFTMTFQDAPNSTPTYKSGEAILNENGIVKVKVAAAFDRTSLVYLSSPTYWQVIRYDLNEDKYEKVIEKKTFYAEPQENQEMIFEGYDYSIEPGHSYQYYSRFTRGNDNDKNWQSTVLSPIDDVLNYFNLEDMLLIAPDEYLRIMYNPKLTGLKNNYIDNIVTTLGGAYPRIRRSGEQKYKTFQIGGLISFRGDPVQGNFESSSLFDCNHVASLENPQTGPAPIQKPVLSDALKTLDVYTQQRVLEKLYRDKVLTFLHSGKTMLFKSFTEGNILISLSSITLEGNQQLDRNIYSFTATATEIAEATPENIKKYITDKQTTIEAPAAYLNEYTISTLTLSEEDEMLLVQQGNYALDESALILEEKDYIDNTATGDGYTLLADISFLEV